MFKGLGFGSGFRGLGFGLQGFWIQGSQGSLELLLKLILIVFKGALGFKGFQVWGLGFERI